MREYLNELETTQLHKKGQQWEFVNAP
jgi:hypothetical protein